MALNDEYNKHNSQNNNNANSLKAQKLSSEIIWKNNYNINISSIFLSCDSNYISAASNSGELIMLNANNGTEKFRTKFAMPLSHSQIDDSTGDVFAFGKNIVTRVSPAGNIIWQKNIQTPIIGGAISQSAKRFFLCYEGNKIVIADYNAAACAKGGVESKGAISGIYAPKFSSNFVVVTYAGDVFYLQKEGTILWQFCIKDRLSSVSVSNDGSIIFIGSQENKVLCLHSEQKVIFNFELRSPVTCTDISEDGKFYGVGCSDGYIYILNDRGETIYYDRPFSNVSKLFISEHAQKIVTLSDNSTITMSKITKRKTTEENARDFSTFIELNSSANEGGNKNIFEKTSIDNFIEL
ncbi:MAG: hypothetical protein QMC67_07450 [Candidatus Wallbacteria bacterium]